MEFTQILKFVFLLNFSNMSSLNDHKRCLDKEVHRYIYSFLKYKFNNLEYI